MSYILVKLFGKSLKSPLGIDVIALKNRKESVRDARMPYRSFGEEARWIESCFWKS